MGQTRQQKKIIVVGLDGGSFDVIDPLIQEGRLPNIERLIANGVRGELESTTPPVTGPAWASFMTGKDPGRHGLFDFVKPVANDWRRKIVSYNDIRAKTLWSILSENGKDLGVINVPLTYPPPEVRGFLISGMLTPGTEFQYTYPAALAKEIEGRHGPYVLDIWWQNYGPKTIDRFLHDLMECTRMRERIIFDLMDRRRWDLFMTVFIGTDRIHHALWDYLFPSGRTVVSRAQNQIRGGIIAYYELVDDIIGRMAEAVDGRGDLLMMSDHGFGPLRGKVHINNWLEDLGYLRFDKNRIRKWKLRKRLMPLLRQLARKGDFLGLRNGLRRRGAKASGRMGAYGFLECIDWSRTRAYAASNTEQGIYINLVGREPLGIVEPGEPFDKTRDAIIEELKGLRHPKTDEKLVSRVFKKEDVYPGPYGEEAPDVIFFLKEGEYLADVQPSDDLIQDVSWKTGSGTHRMKGIFIGHGVDLKKGCCLSGCRIIDICPTILNLMNVPIPDDMDGKVLTEALTDQFLHEFPAQYVASTTDHDSDSREIRGFDSDKEAEHLKDQLKGLGYM